MFTGIVEELGTVTARDAGCLRFHAPLVVSDAVIGASIAVNGVCLTVTDLGPDWWEATAVEETLARSTLGQLSVGDRVNLERPVRAADRLGGHIVQGHVDGTGVVVSPAPDLVVRVPVALARYLVPKGSVAVDGISLTVVQVGDETFGVAVIPHTASATTLGRRTEGDRVNVEIDVLAKYVERLMEPDHRRGGVDDRSRREGEL